MPRVRRVLWWGAVVALAWSAIVLATGGVDASIAGVAVRSRAPGRSLIVGLVLVALQALVYREAFTRDVERLSARLRPALPAFALICGAMLLAQAVQFGSFAASGADASGYVSQAYGWARGRLPRAEPVPVVLPWPSGDASLAPLGYRPGTQPHTIVPTYAPGLPLMMAASAIAAGPCGVYLVVPVCCAILVWLAFVLGRRLAGPWAGAAAALFVATSPIVLFQSRWPMSDVPAATLTSGAICAALANTRRSALMCGLLTAAALLVRPNLPIVALVLLVGVAWSAAGRERWVRILLFALPVAVAAAAIAALYTAWYGAPWNSGYGSAGELVALSNVFANLRRYPVWLWWSQSPLVILAVLPLLPPFNRRVDARAARLSAALFAAVLGSYLLYATFEEWWYLRFLLPAMAALLALLAAAIILIGRALPRQWGAPVAMSLTLLVLAATSRFSGRHAPVNDVREAERRYVEVGVFVRDALPGNAIVLSVQESGSVRHYAGRPIVRWDLIDRAWTARAPAELERLGLHPYLVIEDFELPQFRDWFGMPPEAPLPWPLVARMRDAGGVSVLDLARQARPASPVALQPGGLPWCVPPAVARYGG
jgi:hypothetical protein